MRRKSGPHFRFEIAVKRTGTVIWHSHRKAELERSLPIVFESIDTWTVDERSFQLQRANQLRDDFEKWGYQVFFSVDDYVAHMLACEFLVINVVSLTDQAMRELPQGRQGIHPMAWRLCSEDLDQMSNRISQRMFKKRAKGD